ncbi:phage regulatory CII family protein [Desulfocurvus sp. DL9XJH121]
MTLKLDKLSLYDAIQLSVTKSGKTRDEIAAEVGWAASNANRIFSTENYWPSLPTIARFCVACGNTLLLDWLHSQVRQGGLLFDPEPMDAAALVLSMGRMFRELGDVARIGERSVADGRVSPDEARRLIRELYDVIEEATAALSGLHAVRDAERN